MKDLVKEIEKLQEDHILLIRFMYELLDYSLDQELKNKVIQKLVKIGACEVVY